MSIITKEQYEEAIRVLSALDSHARIVAAELYGGGVDSVDFLDRASEGLVSYQNYCSGDTDYGTFIYDLLFDPNYKETIRVAREAQVKAEEIYKKKREEEERSAQDKAAREQYERLKKRFEGENK